MAPWQYRGSWGLGPSGQNTRWSRRRVGGSAKPVPAGPLAYRPVPRIDWDHVPSEVRAVIESHTGPVTAAHTASAGLNSEIAVILETDGGWVFVKGRPAGRPAVTRRREAAINPYVRHLAPRLLWQANTGGWDLLGFEHVSGRHANYAPGSGHLAVVVTVLCQLGTIRLTFRTSRSRYRPHCQGASLGL